MNPAVPLKILHVEDSPSDTALFSALLKQVVEFDFEIDHAGELSPGLERLGESSYDAVVLDLGLPDSFGLGTYDRVREAAPKTPIIIITGNDDRDLLTEALKRGADNYLIKEAFDGNRVAVAILAAVRKRTLNA